MGRWASFGVKLAGLTAAAGLLLSVTACFMAGGSEGQGAGQLGPGSATSPATSTDRGSPSTSPGASSSMALTVPLVIREDMVHGYLVANGSQRFTGSAMAPNGLVGNSGGALVGSPEGAIGSKPGDGLVGGSGGAWRETPAARTGFT